MFTADFAQLTGHFDLVATVDGNGLTTTLKLTTVPNMSAPQPAV